MKLLYSSTSPYARKVLILAHETGLMPRLEVTTVSPFTDESLRASNPLGKVPALVLDDGMVLYDSAVICDYLDRLHDKAPLIPADGPERWRVLRDHAAAQGVTDAALNLRQQVMREDQAGQSLPADWWTDRQFAAVYAAMDHFENEIDALDGPLTLSQVALACALDYWDFRFADRPWRDDRPRLAAWFDRFSAHEAMRATDPRL